MEDKIEKIKRKIQVENYITYGQNCKNYMHNFITHFMLPRYVTD